ncbi:MAG: AAA family ATPase [Acidimicrobiales bacterium]
MRIAIVGSSGSGKTTLARQVAEQTGCRHIEIDALHHLEGWRQQERDELRAQIADEIEHEHWVCDGNYNSMVGDLVQSAAEAIVVFDLPRRTVLRQVIWRTVRRAVNRQELWNGNREPLSNFTRWDPEKNVIRWSWIHHDQYHEEYHSIESSGAWAHADVVWVKHHADADRWLAGLEPA